MDVRLMPGLALWNTGVLTESTWIPLGLAAAGALAFVGAYKWLRDQFDAQNKKLDLISNRLAELERARHGRWNIEDQRIWELELARRNPTIVVPNSIEITARRRARESEEE